MPPLSDNSPEKWELDEHTRVKHKILEKYFKTWIQILSSSHEKNGYFDCFAGRGVYNNGEPGSPIIVMRAAQEKIDQLSKLRKALCVFIENNTDEERIERWADVMSREWESVDDYFEKYPSLISLFAFVNSMERQGILLKRGLVNRSLIYDFNTTVALTFWEKYEPIILRLRETGNPTYLSVVEWLVGELEKERKKRGDEKSNYESRSFQLATRR